jgi:anti-sigma B factor antagonist
VPQQGLDQRACELTVDGIAGVLVITVNGELDAEHTADLARCLDQAKRGRRRILVDLSGVRFMDSAGLDVLVVAQAALGSRLELVVPPDSSVARLLKLTGSHTNFTVHASYAAAL